MGFGAALLQLAVIGLASPFLELTGDPLHGLIGLVILAVEIRIAWRIAAGSKQAARQGGNFDFLQRKASIGFTSVARRAGR